MSLDFLSADWFAKLEELRAAAAEVEVPAGLVGLVINIAISGRPGDDAQLALVGGFLERGHRPDAGISMRMSADQARLVFIDEDELAGLQSFMAGQIRIEGDATQLRALRETPWPEPMIALQQKIKEMTA